MASNRIHGTHPRESLDKVVLFLAFAIGAGGTVLLKFVEAPVLLVALFPVAVLLIYVVACLSLRSLGTEPETIGDNSYYLGFLFTLASLAVTLYRIRDVGSADVDLIPLVISGFGVALSSTIAGVFLRVFLLQLRPDIVARDREARRELASGARDLREAMAAASRQLKSIAIETQQHVSERNNTMSKVLEVQVEKTSELLERQSLASEEVIKSFGKRMTEEVITALRQETLQASEAINAAAKTFAANLDTMTLSRARAEADLVSSLDAFKVTITEVRDATSRHGKVADASNETLAAHTKKVSQTLTEAADTVQSAVSMSRLIFEEAQAAAGESRTRLRKEEAQFRRHTEAVARALLDLEEKVSERVKEVTLQTNVSPEADDSLQPQATTYAWLLDNGSTSKAPEPLTLPGEATVDAEQPEAPSRRGLWNRR